MVNSSEILLIKFWTSSLAMRKWTTFQLGLPDEFQGIRYSNITQFYASLVTTVPYLCTSSLAQITLRWPVKICRDFLSHERFGRCHSLCLVGRARTAPPRSHRSRSCPAGLAAGEEPQHAGADLSNHQQILQADKTDCKPPPSFLRLLSERGLQRSLSSALINERTPRAAEMPQLGSLRLQPSCYGYKKLPKDGCI